MRRRIVSFELASEETLDKLNDRAERLGHGRPFAMAMSPLQYLLALGGLVEATLSEFDERAAADAPP